MYENFGLLIDGRWRWWQDDKSRVVIDPVNEDVLGYLPAASLQDIEEVLAALAREAPRWRDVSGWERSGYLRRIAAEMRLVLEPASRAMSMETGKPLAEARGEFDAAIDQFEWFADEARRIYGHTLDGRERGVRLDVRYDPVGPVAAFTAWNFPALLPARKIGAALAAGCTIVVRPSEEAPSSTYFIAEAAQKAGVPPGVVNIISGPSGEISSRLIASPIIRKVSLTGSIDVGKRLLHMCADTVKKVSMELGGHAPVLVMADADPVAAGILCAKAKFRNAGQVCVSPSRFYVHESIAEAFTQAMVSVAEKLRVGRGLDDGIEIGPMANSRGRERIIKMVDDAVARGAQLRTGGVIPAEFNRGFFFAPTILGNVPDDALIMHEEPFGPVAPIATFTEFDDVVRRANALPFGLAGYVFSKSLETANRAAEALEVGMVGVNDLAIASAEIPFGGIKESGNGREGGRLGILDYLEPKFIKMRFS